MTPKTLKIYVVEAISGNFMYTSCPIVDFRSAVWLPYRHAVHAKHFGRLTNTLFGAKIGGHHHRRHQCCRVCVVRYCVTAELEDSDRDSRTDDTV